MSASRNPASDSPPASCWKLWIDGCGGFLLIDGDSWTVGGFSGSSPADICVRADWPRRAGRIVRQSADYFWHSDEQQAGVLVRSGTPLPIGGSAQMTLTCPSPLCNSASLAMRGPHRFDGHVDGVILVDQLLLIGPGQDCHIRATETDEQIILLRREGKWQSKRKNQDRSNELSFGQRITVGTLEMTLESA